MTMRAITADIVPWPTRSLRVRQRDWPFSFFDPGFGSSRSPVRKRTLMRYAERLIGTVRRECLDRMLITVGLLGRNARSGYQRRNGRGFGGLARPVASAGRISEKAEVVSSEKDAQLQQTEFMDQFSADETGLGSGLRSFRLANMWFPFFRW
jgi:hypothetical protein